MEGQKKLDWDELFRHYPIFDTFYLFGESGDYLPVLRRRYISLNDEDVLQISLVVLEGEPWLLNGGDDVCTTFILELLRGEDEYIVETTSLSEKEIYEKYPWFLED